MLNFYDLSFVFLQKFPVIMLQTVKSWLQMLVLDRLLDVKYFCKKSTILDVLLGSKYASELRTIF